MRVIAARAQTSSRKLVPKLNFGTPSPNAKLHFANPIPSKILRALRAFAVQSSTPPRQQQMDFPGYFLSIHEYGPALDPVTFRYRRRGHRLFLEMAVTSACGFVRRARFYDWTDHARLVGFPLHCDCRERTRRWFVVANVAHRGLRIWLPFCHAGRCRQRDWFCPAPNDEARVLPIISPRMAH